MVNDTQKIEYISLSVLIHINKIVNNIMYMNLQIKLNLLKKYQVIEI